MVGHVIVRTCPNKVSQHVRLSVCVLVGQEGRRKKKSAARRPRVASWLANSLLSVLIKRSGSTDPFSLLLTSTRWVCVAAFERLWCLLIHWSWQPCQAQRKKEEESVEHICISESVSWQHSKTFY